MSKIAKARAVPLEFIIGGVLVVTLAVGATAVTLEKTGYHNTKVAEHMLELDPQDVKPFAFDQVVNTVRENDFTTVVAMATNSDKRKLVCAADAEGHASAMVYRAPGYRKLHKLSEFDIESQVGANINAFCEDVLKTHTL